ncbi:MAG: VWA domain-containing protein [Thermodesulfobacteriales bacterium]|nr:MAG: VWA domain-containing protein [Thermodesulfobacteriales bacterium]
MNLSFLSPLFLIGLAAIALPVIAHLISRKNSLKKSFPAVKFLISTQGQLASRSRIKDLVLLLLRALILALIVLIFAKPAVFSFSQKMDKTPVSVAIVIDNSFSMGYEDNFKRAQDKAQDMIDSLPDGSFAFITALIPDNYNESHLLENTRLLRKSINEIELSFSFTDNEERLQDIFSYLQNAPTEKKIVALITDFQKNGWSNEDVRKPWLELIDISNGTNSPNHAVSGIDLNYINDSIRVVSRVSNFSNDIVAELLTTTQLGKQEIREFIDIDPQNSNALEASFTNYDISLPGSGSVQTTHDKLKADDVRYFISNYKEESRILIVDGDPREDSRLSETYYLARALETISENAATNITILDNNSILNKDLSDYQLVYLANVGEITPSFAKELEKFVNDGGTVVIFLGNRVSMGSYNALLKNILPGELLSLKEDNLSLILSSASIFPKDITDRTDQIRVEKLFNISIHPESEVLFKTTDDSPFLIKKELGKGNVFMFSSTADTSWNNFSITPVFLPVIKMIHDLPNIKKNKSRHYFVGEPVKIETIEGNDSTIIVDPRGKELKVNIESGEFQNTWLPGIYRVETDSKLNYSFAVNVDPRESKLEKISIPSIESSPEQTRDLVKVFKEIWRYFLWGVIALFVSEAAFRGIFS